MRFDAVQFWMLTATFVLPVLIGASCEEFTKAVAITASVVFLGNLLYASLFGGWDGFGNPESQRLDRAPVGAPGRGGVRPAALVDPAQPWTWLRPIISL